MKVDTQRIGVDLGGTKTEAILADEKLNVLERARVATPAHDYSRIVDTIASLVAKMASFLPDGLSGVGGIGVCTPGTEYGPDRLITNSNTRALRDRPLRRDIRDRLQRDVTVENDANCFALAESVMGAGAQYGTVFGVIMGTGVGGGIVIDRRIHRGRTGMAGEWGHHTLHRDGNQCYCGKRGCVETYLSGPALERRWEELTHTRMTMEQISEQVSSGGVQTQQPRNQQQQQDSARDIWLEEAVENFGHALANVIDIVDPDAVVLGGGLSNVPVWYGQGAESVRGKIFSHLGSDVPILQNRLGDSAGVIGACMI